jgi:hypothetical protein
MSFMHVRIVPTPLHNPNQESGQGTIIGPRAALGADPESLEFFSVCAHTQGLAPTSRFFSISRDCETYSDGCGLDCARSSVRAAAWTAQLKKEKKKKKKKKKRVL